MSRSIILKTPEQVAGIRYSSQVAAEVLRYLGGLVEPGITTDEIDAKASEQMALHSATSACLGYHNFPKSICTSVNDVVCHGIPGEYCLKEGDIVSIDVATVVAGFYGDNCQTFPVGEVSKEARDLMQVTKKCLNIGVKEVFPGNTIGNIGYRIQKKAHKYGYGVVYQFTGHGVGLEFHEAPEVLHVAQKNSGPEIQPGMIFTIEPMINAGSPEVSIDQEDNWTVRTQDGSLSAQFEHTVLVTPKGVEVLTVPS